MYSPLYHSFHSRSALAGTDIRPIWSAGANPRSGISRPPGKIWAPRVRVKFLPITTGDMRRLHGVGFARYFWNSGLLRASAVSSSYTAKYLGPPFTAA